MFDSEEVLQSMQSANRESTCDIKISASVLRIMQCFCILVLIAQVGTPQSAFFLLQIVLNLIMD